MLGNEHAAAVGAPLTGKVVLGRYRIVRPLAKGGMGVVYLGRVEGSAGFAKPVVVKSVVSSLDGHADTEQLFAREARIVSTLQHPNIVAVVDFGRVEASYVMVLEYIHGYHLGQWLRFVNRKRGRMPVPHAVHVILGVLDALSFAHNLARPDGAPLEIVHRDVSPANILIDLQGQIKLSDFGIARTADDEYKTQQGTFRGTLPYSAPEALDATPPSPKLDQYAVGVILYQLLAGLNPFRSDKTTETIARITTLVPPPLTDLRDDVPVAIDAAVARAISKNPEERFANVADFAQALRDGSTWSEREAAQTFAAQIKADFAGDELASTLNLESLAVRDASWRDAQTTHGTTVGLSSSPPTLTADSLPPTEPNGPLAAAPKPASSTAASGRLLPAVLVAGVAAAGLLAFLLRQPAESAPKVLVIEKQDTAPALAVAPQESESPSPAPAPQASAEAAPAGTASAANATAATRRTPAPAPAADRGTTLARAFQRQESKIQGCFQQHSAGLEAQSGISVRFQIDASGHVQRAQVVPSSVGATPLGACLVAVAQGTAFGPQPEGVSFAIPISARVVRK